MRTHLLGPCRGDHNREAPLLIIVIMIIAHSNGQQGSRVKEKLLSLGQPLVGHVQLLHGCHTLQAFHHRDGIAIQVPDQALCTVGGGMDNFTIITNYDAIWREGGLGGGGGRGGGSEAIIGISFMLQ